MNLNDMSFIGMTAELVPVLDKLQEIFDKYKPSSIVISTIGLREGVTQSIKTFNTTEKGYEVFTSIYEGDVITVEPRREYEKECIQSQN